MVWSGMGPVLRAGLVSRAGWGEASGSGGIMGDLQGGVTAFILSGSASWFFSSHVDDFLKSCSSLLIVPFATQLLLVR